MLRHPVASHADFVELPSADLHVVVLPRSPRRATPVHPSPTDRHHTPRSSSPHLRSDARRNAPLRCSDTAPQPLLASACCSSRRHPQPLLAFACRAPSLAASSGCRLQRHCTPTHLTSIFVTEYDGFRFGLNFSKSECNLMGGRVGCGRGKASEALRPSASPRKHPSRWADAGPHSPSGRGAG